MNNKPTRRISDIEMLGTVNWDVNTRVEYLPDDLAAVDYWQSPRETWTKMTGDCEDIAIVKYFALKASNRFDDSRLRLAFVKLHGKGHLVLLAKVRQLRREKWWRLWEKPMEFDDWLVLDNACDSLYRLDQTQYVVEWWINETDYTIAASGIRYEPSYKPQWADMIKRK